LVQHWTENFPTHVENKLVEFQGDYSSPPTIQCETDNFYKVHDFFTSQPIKNASVFLLRFIIHDWTNAESICILKHLRAAATPSTNLVLIEKIVPAVSGDDDFQDIPGAARPRAQPPLLPNWGVASVLTYTYDMTVRLSLSLSA
jgi:hypothetical protein